MDQLENMLLEEEEEINLAFSNNEHTRNSY